MPKGKTIGQLQKEREEARQAKYGRVHRGREGEFEHELALETEQARRKFEEDLAAKEI